ncbi:MAG: glucose 1-dehydrogenase [Proteobacteria bacterium]|nr:glucose 1-dehydrogenase [Pseudomonadota bacterium]
MDFTDKKILITGGSRGIGAAAARAFLERGARVAVNGRTADSVAAAMSEFGAGDRVVAAPGDVGTVAGCEAAVAAAIDGLEGLDILINSAGVGHSGLIEEMDEATWDETLDVNLKGTFFCIKAALAALRISGGNIVNLASDAGLIGEHRLVVYCASKGGVVNMTRAMALDLAPEVRVNCVCPGYVDTDMVRRDGIEKSHDPAAAEERIVNYAPMKRISTPEEIAMAIVYLASDEARFVTGAALAIDGGSSAGR